MNRSDTTASGRRRARFLAPIVVGAVVLAGCGTTAMSSPHDPVAVSSGIRPRPDVHPPLAPLSPSALAVLNSNGSSTASDPARTTAPRVAHSAVPVATATNVTAGSARPANTGKDGYIALLGQLNSYSQAVLNDSNLTTPQRRDLAARIAAGISGLQALLNASGPTGQFPVAASSSTYALLVKLIPEEQAADALLTDGLRIAPLAAILIQRTSQAVRRGQPVDVARAALQDFLTQTTAVPTEATAISTTLTNLPSDVTAAEAQIRPIPAELKAIRDKLVLARSDYFTVLATTLLPGQR